MTEKDEKSCKICEVAIGSNSGRYLYNEDSYCSSCWNDGQLFSGQRNLLKRNVRHYPVPVSMKDKSQS